MRMLEGILVLNVRVALMTQPRRMWEQMKGVMRGGGEVEGGGGGGFPMITGVKTRLCETI